MGMDMPVTVEREFSVNAPAKDVWELLNNPQELGKCVPSCEGVIVLSPTEWRWKVKFAVGIISRRVEARAHLIQIEPPTNITIKIESMDGELAAQLAIEVQEKDTSSSQVKFSANVDARGSFQWVVNQIVKSQLDKLISEFAKNVSTKLHSLTL
jgi:carbon monoxide dehydrogenase subunit G